MPMHVGKQAKSLILIRDEIVVTQHESNTEIEASGMLAGLDIAIATQLDASGFFLPLARNPVRCSIKKTSFLAICGRFGGQRSIVLKLIK